MNIISKDLSTNKAMLLLLILNNIRLNNAGWNDWSSSSSGYNYDPSLYSQGGYIGWMNSFTSMKMSIHGCVYSQVNDLDDLSCIEKGSEDGTYYWYQMVNCRRAQVAFTIYASDSSTAQCKKDYYIETFSSLGGVSEFAYYLEKYGADDYVSSDYTDNYSGCSSDGNGYYQGLACSAEGDFIVAKFYDKYCLSYDSTVKTLTDLTYAMQKYSCYDCSSGLCATLVQYSESCSPNEYAICQDSYGKKMNTYKSVSSQTGAVSTLSNTSQVSSLPTKLKYTAGSLLLISSFIMFLGILSTSRRKRRTALQRKYRTSTNRSYDDDGGRDSSRRRSNSRARSSSRARGSSKAAEREKRSRSRSRAADKSGKYRSSSRKHRDRKEPDGTWA